MTGCRERKPEEEERDQENRHEQPCTSARMPSLLMRVLVWLVTHGVPLREVGEQLGPQRPRPGVRIPANGLLSGGILLDPVAYPPGVHDPVTHCGADASSLGRPLPVRSIIEGHRSHRQRAAVIARPVKRASDRHGANAASYPTVRLRYLFHAHAEPSCGSSQSACFIDVCIS